MEILAIIPGRGGSKGVPGKNIKMLLGKPLIAWTIEEAKKSKYLTRIMVSTDSQEIADIAKQYGAEVPFLRPVEISGDLATDVEFLLHALDFLKEKENYEPEIILRLPPTSPLRTAAHIDEGIQKLIDTPEADAVRPMTEVPKHPYKFWKISADERFIEPFLDKNFTGIDEPYNMPRQSLPKVYVHSGAMDVMRLKTIRGMKSTSGKKLAYFYMRPEDSVNIDNELDFKLAENILKKRLNINDHSSVPTFTKKEIVNREQKFNFENFIIFEMANNHQGSLEHGLKIINTVADISRRYELKSAVKFQFRHIDTIIHPDHKENSNNKHIPRFLSTRLTEDEYRTLFNQIKSHGLLTIATPFDELSVDMLERLGIEIIKIGSCSAQDWPLLQRVAKTGKPVICSTGGLEIKDIDKVVSFFQHRGVNFALEHCVAIYPTPNEQFHLNQLELMKNRYPHITIGFSTHESPDNLSVIGLAYAKGARIFEKHIGFLTADIKLNAYSANPEQAENWIKALQAAMVICGGTGEREITAAEIADLNSLQRGVFARKSIKTGDPIKDQDVFFALPWQVGQLTSGQFQENLIADKDYNVNQPLNVSLRQDKLTKKDIVYASIHAIKGMLNEAKIPIGYDFSVELSHHYGLERFREFGCTIIEVINREYAKKIIVQLPGQYNPNHYHQKKDETFQVLSGAMTVEVEDRHKMLQPGDVLWIPRGVWHSFGTEQGVIFEEISSTSYGDDSYYANKKIVDTPREQRKTRLINWGRHQFDEFIGVKYL